MKPNDYWQHRTFLAEKALTELIRTMATALPHSARALEAVSREWSNNVDALTEEFSKAGEEVIPALDVISSGVSNDLRSSIFKLLLSIQQTSPIYQEAADIIGKHLAGVRVLYSDFLQEPADPSARKSGIYGADGGESGIGDGSRVSINVLIIKLGDVWLRVELNFTEENPIGLIYYAIKDQPFAAWQPNHSGIPTHLIDAALTELLEARAGAPVIDPAVNVAPNLELGEEG